MSGKAKGAAIIKDFTVGSIPKQLLRFSVPFILSNVLQLVYSLVDMAVVGRFVGSSGLSAVSTASQLCNFLTMLCVGFASGGQVYISQLIGAGRKDELNRTIGTLFTSIVGICLLMMGVSLLSHRGVLDLLNTPKEAYDMAVDYALISTVGLIFTYGYNTVSAVLRGMGDSKHPLIFILIASVANLVLDLIFVPVLGWSVAGAALATIIGQAISFIFALVFLFKRRGSFGFDFRLKSLLPDKDILKTLTKVGVPFALRSGAINISMMFVSSMVNSFGVVASAVFGTGIKIDDIINKTTVSLTYSSSAMIGQNIGAKDFGRTKKIVYWCLLFSVAAYAAFTVIYLIWGQELFGLFTDDAEVIALAPVFISALVWSFPAMALMRATSGFITGVGNSKLSLLFALIDSVVLRITLSYLIGVVFDQGLFGFFLGYGLAAYGTAIPGLLYFFFGKWESYSLLGKKKAA